MGARHMMKRYVSLASRLTDLSRLVTMIFPGMHTHNITGNTHHLSFLVMIGYLSDETV